MAFPTAGGYRSIAASSMKYVPTLYASELLPVFNKKTLFKGISNTRYNGQITKQGDTIEIRSVPSFTIDDYRVGGGVNYRQPKSDPVTMLIDKGKSWAFPVNPVEQVQSDITIVRTWAAQAGVDLQVAIDADVLGNVYADAHASNIGNSAGADSGNIGMGVSGGTAISVTTANGMRKITEMGQILDEESAPDEGRWVILPPWYWTVLINSDLKSANMMGDSTSVMRNGQVGVIDKFKVYSSRNLGTTTDGSSDTCHYILFGTNDAIAFAMQLTQSEIVPNPDDYGKLYRSLVIYGYKVVKPEALGVMVAKQGSW